MTLLKAIAMTAALAVACQFARAEEYLQLKYQSCVPTQTGVIAADGILNGPARVGQINLLLNTSSGYSGSDARLLLQQAVGGVISTFCVDLSQDVSTAYQTYNLTALENAPVNKTGVTMGTQRANDLRKLFAAHWTAKMTDNMAAAFQSDIWEIINETSGNYSLGTGSFQITEKSGSGWVALGNAWLAELPNLTAMRNDVIALTSSTYQDFGLAVPGVNPNPGSVPELDPGLLISALVLLLGGMFIITAQRRTGTKAVCAQAKA